MLNTIQDFVKSILPSKRKTSPNGWISFNCPCCIHNGENADTRGRGGLTANADGSVSYHCFNCKFKASYQPGRHLTFKFRKFLRWMGADENDIKRLVIEAIRIRELVDPDEVKQEAEEKVEFKARYLPEHALSFKELRTFYTLSGEHSVPSLLDSAVNYVYQRKINTDKYDFYWTDDTEHSLHQRVLIPCIWEGKIIGYTGRAFVDGVKPKYFNHYESNFVFNMNNQLRDSKFVIVVEGPFDAMAIDGVAILGNECNEIQADIIESLGKEVIVVPDFDIKNGKWPGEELIKTAQEYGWSVSFPVWNETCKDVGKAVETYGKLFVLKTILDAKETSRLKIELMRKRLHA